MSDELGSRLSRAVRITTTATIALGLIQLPTTIVLARLLAPADYGAFALVASMAALTTGFVGGAFERALVVLPSGKIFAELSWPLCGSIGVVGLATTLLGIVLSLTNEIPVSVPLLIVAAISGTVGSLAIVPRATLRRNLSYGAIAGAELTAQVVGSSIVAICLAVLGFGPFALAGGTLVNSTVVALAFVYLAPRRPDQTGDRVGFRELVRSAASLGRFSALEILHSQIPTLWIGPALGTATLGLFNRAAQIVQLPVQLLTTSMSRVLISGIVTVAEDKERLRRAFELMIIVPAAIITPIAGGVAGSGAAFTQVILGPKWAAATDLIPVLAATTWLVMCGNLFASFAEATRHFDLKVTIQLVTTATLVVALAICAGHGLYWACLAIAAAAAVFLALYVPACAKIAGTRVETVIGWLAPGLVAAALCFIFSSLVSGLIDAPALFKLIAQVAGCGCVAALYYAVFHIRLVRLILRAAWR